jgi:hypothetical protein
MATAVEILVNSLFKYLDVDKNDIIARGKALVEMADTQIKNFDSRLSILEHQNAQLIDQNAHYIAILNHTLSELHKAKNHDTHSGTGGGNDSSDILPLYTICKGRVAGGER